MAGSLLADLKGHNPAEPAKLRSAIVTGPWVESFQDLFEALIAAKGAVLARDAIEIAVEIVKLWRDEALRTQRIDAAEAVMGQGAAALDTTVAQLSALLPAPQSTRAANASA